MPAEWQRCLDHCTWFKETWLFGLSYFVLFVCLFSSPTTWCEVLACSCTPVLFSPAPPLPFQLPHSLTHPLTDSHTSNMQPTSVSRSSGTILQVIGSTGPTMRRRTRRRCLISDRWLSDSMESWRMDRYGFHSKLSFSANCHFGAIRSFNFLRAL